MKKLFTTITAIGLSATFIVPSLAAKPAAKSVHQKPTTTVSAPVHKAKANPAKKFAKGVKKDLGKMDKSVKRMLTPRHKHAKNATVATKHKK